MCVKKLNLLWDNDKNLFIHLTLLQFLNSLFLYLFLTTWTLQMIKNDFSANEIAICYGIAQISRLINAIIVKYYKWYVPILLFLVHITLLIPAIFSPNEFPSHVILSFFKIGDMFNIYSIRLGILLDKRKHIGTIDNIEHRYRFSTTIFILVWIVSYSLSLLIGGALYQIISFQLILIIQMIGVIKQVVYYTLLNWYYKTTVTDTSNITDTVIVKNVRRNWSLLDITLVFILPIPIFGASSLFGQFMPIIYNKFNINSVGSSFFLIIGEIIGSFFFVYKTLGYNLKINNYFFREPRQFLLIIFLFGAFYTLMSTNILVLTVISNIFCSFCLAILTKIHNNYIFVYSKSDFKLYRGLFIIFQCIGRILTAISSPYLFEIYPGLPFQICGILLMASSLFSFCVFKRHIYLNYDENIFCLSKSIFKLEIEKQRGEDIYESEEEIVL